MMSIRSARWTSVMILAAVIVASVVPSSHLLAQSQPKDGPGKTPDLSGVRSLMQMAATDTPSMAVAVTRGNEILWEEGFGYIDYPGGTRATPNTPYYCASVTKAFTATALMILQERKQLDLDRPANEYLTQAKLTSPHWNANEATVRRVAIHTAGLTTYDREWVQGLNQERVSFAEIIRRYGIIFSRPGDRFDYSNLGYGILGEIVANVSKRSFGDFLKEEIFRPLGMEHSSFGVDPKQPTAPRYNPYLKAVRPPSEATAPGASGLYSSAHDLALFGMFHLQTRRLSQRDILSATGIGHLMDPTVDAGGGNRHSLAWSVNDDQNGYRTLLAQGGTGDAQAWLLLVPAEKIAVAVIGNSGTTPARNMIDEILSTLLPLYKTNREERARYAASHPTPTPARPSPPPAEAKGTWTGRLRTYKSDIALTLNITSTGDIDATLGQNPVLKLTNTRFRDNRVFGRMVADLGINDTDGVAYELRFYLDRYEDRLIGAATTYALPGRDGPRLSFWVELTRRAESSPLK
jgi:CubicO group peptidase (beta-lactamase class C family)